MRNLTRTTFLSTCLLVLWFLPFAGAQADIVSQALEYLTRQVAERAHLSGKTVTVSANDMYDVGTGQNLPLSELLRDKVMDSLKTQGVKVREAADTSADQWSIQVQWKVRRDDLHITFLALLRPKQGAARMVSRSSRLPLDTLDIDLLIPDFHSFARTLVRQLERGSKYRAVHTVHLRPVDSAKDSDSGEVGKYFERWLSGALDQSSLFRRAAEEKLYDVPVQELRQRGNRRDSMAPARNADNSMSLAGELLDAETEVRANVSLRNKKVRVDAELRDRSGASVAKAAVEFDTDLLAPKIAAALLAEEPAQKEKVSRHSGFSRNGLMVELTTTRGEGSAEFTEGSLIRFLIRVNRSSFLYLFDFNSKGEVVLLYPESLQAQERISSGEPVVLPDDKLDYAFEVQPPFGKDLVLAVASEQPLRIPHALNGVWSTSAGVIEQVRKLGETSSGGYAEARLELVTSQ